LAGNIYVQATEVLILARAKEFVGIVPSGRFQGMIASEHKHHHLDRGFTPT
jgi:hypothetical protein